MIVGGVAGTAAGLVVDRAHSRVEVREQDETNRVANMLATDQGGIQRGTVRVHRDEAYITALAQSASGRNRIIRLRYDGSNRNRPTSDTEVQRLREERSDLEQTLLEILIQMSYARGDRGVSNGGNNVILQPEESFEELIRRFGLGTQNRGASQEIISSYPVVTVQAPEKSESESDDEAETDVCGICLDEQNTGDSVKPLQCGHSFHAVCIDTWLKRNATCPICKANVKRYVAPTKSEEAEYLGCD